MVRQQHSKTPLLDLHYKFDSRGLIEMAALGCTEAIPKSRLPVRTQWARVRGTKQRGRTRLLVPQSHAYWVRHGARGVGKSRFGYCLGITECCRLNQSPGVELVGPAAGFLSASLEPFNHRNIVLEALPVRITLRSCQIMKHFTHSSLI